MLSSQVKEKSHSQLDLVLRSMTLLTWSAGGTNKPVLPELDPGVPVERVHHAFAEALYSLCALVSSICPVKKI
jgi:hypothetical protein